MIGNTVFRRRASESCHTHGATLAPRNETSKKIATSLGVPVNDLYGLVIANREKLRLRQPALHALRLATHGQHIAARLLESFSQ